MSVCYSAKQVPFHYVAGCRMVPCYHVCSNQPESDNSLWTDKYQPKSATEVTLFVLNYYDCKR